MSDFTAKSQQRKRQHQAYFKVPNPLKHPHQLHDFKDIKKPWRLWKRSAFGLIDVCNELDPSIVAIHKVSLFQRELQTRAKELCKDQFDEWQWVNSPKWSKEKCLYPESNRGCCALWASERPTKVAISRPSVAARPSIAQLAEHLTVALAAIRWSLVRFRVDGFSFFPSPSAARK